MPVRRSPARWPSARIAACQCVYCGGPFHSGLSPGPPHDATCVLPECACRGPERFTKFVLQHIVGDAVDSPLAVHQSPTAQSAGVVVAVADRPGKGIVAVSPRVEELDTWLSAWQRFHYPLYKAAWLACRLIAASYGESQLFRFYRTVNRTDCTATALLQVLGTTPAAFAHSWRAYLRHLAATG